MLTRPDSGGLPDFHGNIEKSTAGSTAQHQASKHLLTRGEDGADRIHILHAVRHGCAKGLWQSENGQRCCNLRTTSDRQPASERPPLQAQKNGSGMGQLHRMCVREAKLRTHRSRAKHNKRQCGIARLHRKQHDEGRCDAPHACSLVFNAQHGGAHERWKQLCASNLNAGEAERLSVRNTVDVSSLLTPGNTGSGSVKQAVEGQ
jgi:hypothetical protein